MADIYDVNAAIQKPNIVNALREGQQYGMRLREQQRQQQDANRLRELAPQIISGEPTAYAQGAAINPEAAGQYQQAGDSQLRRLKGAIAYFDQGLKSGDDRVIQARYREIAPFLTSLTGRPSPEAYTPGMLPAFEQVKTKIAMAGNAEGVGVIQSQKISDDGYIINTYRDGRIEKTDQKVDRQAWFRDNPGQDPVIVGKDGTATAITAPQSTAPPYSETTYAPTGNDETAQIEADIGRPLSPQERAQIANGTFNLQVPAGQPAPVQTLPRRPSAAEEAEAVARARAGVELSMAPIIAGATEGAKLDANLSRADQLAAADANRQRQIDEAKAQAEKNAARPGLDASYNLYQVARDGLVQALEGARTGPVAGRLPAMQAADQNADSAVASMAPVLKQLFRSAGEGVFTDKDQQMLLDMMPTRAMLPAARMDAIRRIDAIVQAKLQGGGSTANSGGYRVGQVIEVNGKRYRVTGGDPNDPDVEEVR